MSVVVTACDLVTAYGWGVEACWQGLLSGRPSFAPVRRFDTHAFQCHAAGTVADLDPARAESLV